MFEFEEIEEDFYSRQNAELGTKNYETLDERASIWM